MRMAELQKIIFPNVSYIILHSCKVRICFCCIVHFFRLSLAGELRMSCFVIGLVRAISCHFFGLNMLLVDCIGLGLLSKKYCSWFWYWCPWRTWCWRWGCLCIWWVILLGHISIRTGYILGQLLVPTCVFLLLFGSKGLWCSWLIFRLVLVIGLEHSVNVFM